MILHRKWLSLGLAMLLPACTMTVERDDPVPPAVAAAVATAPMPVDNHSLDLLNAVLWARTSAELRASYLQAYGQAGKALDAALDPKNRASWTADVDQRKAGGFATLPPAIIVDVDETVLDTSDYMLEQIRIGRPYEKPTWNRYVQRRDAPALPGALEFLKAVAARGVTVFYISNREVFDETEQARKPEAERLYDEDEPTRVNLAAHGFPNTGDLRTFLFRDAARGWKEKGPRRAEIAKTHRIIMLVGDNLYDLIDIPGPEQTRASRYGVVEANRAWLGTRWIMLPNPMYGSWETLYTAGMTQADARRAKLAAIGLADDADTIIKGGFEP